MAAQAPIEEETWRQGVHAALGRQPRRRCWCVCAGNVGCQRELGVL